MPMQVCKHKALKRYAALLLGYSRTELDTAIRGGALIEIRHHE
jgi:hypothetical protein